VSITVNTFRDTSSGVWERRRAAARSRPNLRPTR
jgi:hypothetical protein